MNIKNETLRYLGVKGAPDSVIASLVERAEKAFSTLSPAYCCLIVKKSECEKLLAGNDIKNHLKNCERVIIFAATLGTEADRLIRAAQVSDMAYAVVLDAYASALIEDFCDRCEGEMKQKTYGFFTWRFSPGYGDYPIALQNEFIRFLSADKRIGLTATQSHILIPRKSVTAAIGISETALDDLQSGCDRCNLKETCKYRKDGQHCGH